MTTAASRPIGLRECYRLMRAEGIDALASGIVAILWFACGVRIAREEKK